MDKEELLPCPFCGSSAKLVFSTDDTQGRDWHEIYCTGCEIGTQTSPRKDKVITAWNTRISND